MNIYATFGKRFADVIAASLAIIFLSPLLIITGLVVRSTMGRPVLFRQMRPGLNGRLFTLLKFRTLTNEKDDSGNLLPDERRLTKIGMLLRSTSIDELPELWNILRGDMSFVGPRPLLPEYLPRYSPRQARRHEVRPGLTGWAQVNGRNSLGWSERFERDVWYVENMSISLDIKILVRSVGLVMSRRGVSADGQTAMSPFDGTN